MATPKKSGAKKVAKAGSGKSKSAKAGLVFPVGRVSSLLRKGRYARRVSATAGVYAAAVLEYLTAELLSATAKVHAQGKKKTSRVTPRHVCLAVRHDADLGTLLAQATISRGGVPVNVHEALLAKKKGSKKSSATPKM